MLRHLRSTRSVLLCTAVLSGQLLMLTMTTRFQPVFMTTVRFFAVALSDVASRVATLAVVACLVAARADVVWFAVAQLVPPAVALVMQGGAAARQISLRPVFSRRESADLLRESLALMGVMVVGILYCAGGAYAADETPAVSDESNALNEIVVTASAQGVKKLDASYITSRGTTALLTTTSRHSSELSSASAPTET